MDCAHASNAGVTCNSICGSTTKFSCCSHCFQFGFRHASADCFLVCACRQGLQHSSSPGRILSASYQSDVTSAVQSRAAFGLHPARIYMHTIWSTMPNFERLNVRPPFCLIQSVDSFPSWAVVHLGISLALLPIRFNPLQHHTSLYDACRTDVDLP